jgi:hypothetical protein
MSHAAEFLGIGFQKPYLELNVAVVNGSLKYYPSNGVNFASGGSGVLPGTDKAEVCKSSCNICT